jgi:hypothetical protein
LGDFGFPSASAQAWLIYEGERPEERKKRSAGSIPLPPMALENHPSSVS